MSLTGSTAPGFLRSVMLGVRSGYKEHFECSRCSRGGS